MSLLRTLAIIILFYYGFKFLTRYIFPVLLSNWAENKMKEFQQQTKGQQKAHEEAKQFAKKNEGKVKIQSTNKSNKSESDGLGDYVDYEEVE